MMRRGFARTTGAESWVLAVQQTWIASWRSRGCQRCAPPSTVVTARALTLLPAAAAAVVCCGLGHQAGRDGIAQAETSASRHAAIAAGHAARRYREVVMTA